MADVRFSGWQSPFTVFGVRLRIHISWLIIAVLIAWSLASGSLPAVYEGLPAGSYWVMALMIVAGLAASIVLHELAHTLAGRAVGMSVDRITLFVFGGVAELRDEPRSAGAELAMAIAGPAFSLALSAALALAAGTTDAVGGPEEAVYALGYLAAVNLALAVFNLLPAFPMDGGRVLRAVLWMLRRDLGKATRQAARTGQGVALLLMAGGALSALTSDVSGGLWLILIGLFVHGAASGELVQLEARAAFAGHRVAELMVRAVETVPADLTLDRFVDERLLASRHGAYPVVSGARWVGLLDSAALLAVPRERWARTTAAEVCRPAEALPRVGPHEDLAVALERMQRAEASRLVVADGETLVGLLTLKDLLARLQLQRRFGTPPA